ncbi:MAG: helix-turn-helix domain-containing protein [Treponema sp.]|nr:helix-turn-helix domain-containing protein [Treponema sp.]
MESYGALLKKTREEKGFDVFSVSRDTTISCHYIEALENEEPEIFPGEPYFIGFLKNYAEYLGLNSDTVISLYKNKKLQESPIPDGLIPKHYPIWIAPTIVLLVIVALSGIVFGTYKLVQHIIAVRVENAATEIEEKDRFHVYNLSDKPLQKRLYKGDKIVIGDSESESTELTVVDTLGVLSLDTPSGTQVIDLSEEVELDVDNDSIPDIIVYVSDISNADANRGANVRMLLKTGGVSGSVNIAAIPSDSELPKNAVQTEILKDNRAYPFTINATFRADCLFRYRIDRKEPIEEYYHSGDTVTITSNNGTRLWMSNGNVVKLQVIADGSSHELEAIKAGHVQTEDVKWVKTSDGKYKLVVLEID